MVKRRTIGRNVYQCETGAYWLRLNLGGARTWRRLSAQNQRDAFKEAELKVADARKLVNESRRAKFGVNAKIENASAAIPSCLEPLRPNLLEVHLPPTITGAIYFLMCDDICVYVGQTKQTPLLRASQHTDKHFNRILILPTPVEQLDSVEEAYISELKPKYNVKLIKAPSKLILAQARAAGI